MEILEQEYNRYYEEYKAYDKLASEIAAKIKQDREDFKKFAYENQEDVKALEDKLFEVNEKQILHLQDLATLKARLKIATDLLRDVIEIPKEVLQEVDKFPNIELLFKPSNDVFVEINPEKITKIKEHWKGVYKQQIDNIITKNE